MSYSKDIAALRRQFKEVDIKDPSAIQKWFADHPYLTTNDHAQIAERSLFWIRKLKRFANIKQRTPKILPISKPRKSVNTLVAPVDWDNQEWLRETAKTHNVTAMAIACGISRRYMRDKLTKYKIKQMGEKAFDPKSDKYNYQWVYEHYVTKRLSQAKCAKLAGISRQTFCIWLNRLKIAVRGKSETNSNRYEVKLWVRKLIYQLKQLETVRKIFIRHDHIHVRFKNFYWESYYIEKHVNYKRSYAIYEQDAIIEKIPSVRFKYESDMDQEYYPAHVYICRKEWKKASFIERRIAMHEFARVIARRGGWIRPSFPLNILHCEKAQLLNYEYHNHIFDNALTACPRVSCPYPGLKTILHFVDVSYIWDIFKSPKQIMITLNQLIQKTIEINTYNLVRMMHETRYIKFKIYDPRVYVALFELLTNINSVFDLNPGNGYLAIACAIAKIKYYAPQGHKIIQALQNGMADHLGLQWEVYDNQNVDCTISCDDFQFTNIIETFNYSDRSKLIVQFVPCDLKFKILRLYNPHRIIQVKTNIYKQNEFDNFFIFKPACQI